jgi:hypothetical protein
MGNDYAPHATAKKRQERVMASANATTDHDEIRSWVEERGGTPARGRPVGSRRTSSSGGTAARDVPQSRAGRPLTKKSSKKRR